MISKNTKVVYRSSDRNTPSVAMKVIWLNR